MAIQKFQTTQSMGFKGIVVVGWQKPVFVHIGDCFHDRALPERIKAHFKFLLTDKSKKYSDQTLTYNSNNQTLTPLDL